MIQNLYNPLKAQCIKLKYHMTLHRLRKKYGKKKIRIGFLVSEISKWKGQTLYDYLLDTDDFLPVIFIYPSPHELKAETKDSILIILEEKERYFLDCGMNVESIWDTSKSKCIHSSDIDADILFYQQPWDIPPAPLLEDIASKALTFYFPYYLVNNFIPEWELKMYLHYYVYRYIVLNERLVEIFKPYVRSSLYSGKMVGLGHPSIDLFYLQKDYKTTKNYVIYAPHFSFKCDRHTGKDLPYYSSTFLEQGKLILDFAKHHPEINWAFKPHPRLRTELTDYNIWTKQEVDEYYQEWERIGTACYDSQYIELFFESKAMITDCSSFLSEYSCTGKPLIRLIPYEGRYLAPPNPALEKLYDCFYKSYNDIELVSFLEMVVIDNKDPMKKSRIEQVVKAKLVDNYAAQNITDYIRELLNNKQWMI